MEAKIFTEKIYGPYGDAWKVIKILAKADEGSPALGEVLHHYMDEVDKFGEKYKDNEFAQELYKMLLNADDHIVRMGRE